MFRTSERVPPLRLRSTRLSMSPLAVNVPVPVSLSEPRIEITLAFSVTSLTYAPPVSAATDFWARETARGSLVGVGCATCANEQIALRRRNTATMKRCIHVLRDHIRRNKIVYKNACRQLATLNQVSVAIQPRLV